MAKAKELLAELSSPGPHAVLHADLALVGMPGVVFTPAAGRNLPAVAFGHGWLQSSDRYRGLLRHLASWGIVVGAPDTQRGMLPSHRLFATDLITVLELVSTVRLGEGDISVDRRSVGLVGHSTGGGAAVLAAAELASRGNHTSEKSAMDVKAVATVSVAQVLPSATEAASLVSAPSLHLAGDDDRVAPADVHARRIAEAWAGPSQLRVLSKSTHLAITEGKHWSQLLLPGKSRRATQQLTRALLTAFFLTELTKTSKYESLVDADLKKAPIHELSESVVI